MFLRREPRSPSHVSNMTIVGSRTLAKLLSRSHVLSMTGGCVCPIYYRGVINDDKGSVIIRYKKNKLTYQIYYKSGEC